MVSTTSSKGLYSALDTTAPLRPPKSLLLLFMRRLPDRNARGQATRSGSNRRRAASLRCRACSPRVSAFSPLNPAYYTSAGKPGATRNPGEYPGELLEAPARGSDSEKRLDQSGLESRR